MPDFEIKNTVSLLSKALKRKRESLALSLQDVEDLVGIHRSTLSRIEREIGNPDADTIAILANWLNIPLARLYHDDLSVITKLTKPVPEIIDEHLQNDESLGSEGKSFLSAFFKQTYQQFLIIEKNRKKGGRNALTPL